MHNSRADLFERSTESQFYSDRLAYWIFLIVPVQAIATKCLERFKEFPHRARAASFSIGQVVVQNSAATFSYTPGRRSTGAVCRCCETSWLTRASFPFRTKVASQ
jgi:hypothetical protein